MAKAKIPGLSLGIAVRGRRLVCRGYGFRDREARLPATPMTVYGLASVTKSFTALAILQLEEAGRLRINAPVVRYLPEFRTPNPRWTRRITLHHFLTHTSGLPPLPTLFYAEARTAAYSLALDAKSARRVGLDPAHPPIDTYEGLMEYLETERYRLLGPPGRYFSYSNDAYGLLGAVIERVTDQSYESYLEENVLRPAGMRHTTFDTGIMFRFPEVTTLYSPRPTVRRRGLVPSQDWLEDTCMRADGALRSNLDDMLRYLEIYRTEGKVGRERIVREASIRRMLRAHATIAPGLAYGFGVFVLPDYHGTRVVFHGGSLPGLSTHFTVLPERGVTGVALCNADQAPAGTILQGGINALLGLPRRTSVYDAPSPGGKPTDLPSCTGWYGSGEGIWLHVTPRATALLVDVRSAFSVRKGLRFQSKGPNQFVMRPGTPPLRFELDDRGRPWAASFGFRLVRRRSRAERQRATAGRMVW